MITDRRLAYCTEQVEAAASRLRYERQRDDGTLRSAARIRAAEIDAGLALGRLAEAQGGAA